MNYGALQSIPRETNINGQFHQLSYIRPDEAELLKSMGGAGTAGPGGVPQYGILDWANENLGTNFNTGSSTSTTSDNNNNDDKGFFETVYDTGADLLTEIFTLGTADTDLFNSENPSNTFITDVGTAASDVFTEIITGGEAETETFNKVFKDNGGTSHTTKAAADLANKKLVEMVQQGLIGNVMDVGKTYAQLEAEAKAAGESMFIFQGNYYAIVDEEDAESIEGTNTVVGGSGDDDDDDDAESIEGITTEFFDAFGNSYATQARATAADKKAEEQSTAAKAGVTVLHTSTGLPYFYDNGGKQHSTLAGAINANETIDLNAALDSGTLEGPFNEQLGLTFTDSRGLFHTSQADADAADSAYAIEDSASTAVSSGSDEVQSYVDQFGTTGLEDRFLTTLINPATGLPYEPTDTNIVNPLDADTIPYSPDGYSDSEIQILGGDPYQTTVDGIVQTDDAFRDPTTEGDGQHGQTFDADDIVDLAVIENGVVVDDGISSDNSLTFKDEDYQRTRDVRGTKDVYGDFIGGKSRGLWDRAPTYITRFGYTPGGIDEMVRVVTLEDGTKQYFGADGALLNPELMEGVRLRGDPTSLKIGEENVLLGTQTLNPDGTVSGTSYTDQYDPETDASLFNYQ